MRQIYHNANIVLAWLGRDEDNQAERAVAAFHEIGASCCKNKGISVDNLDQVDDILTLMPKRTFELDRDDDESWSAVAWLLSLSWFNRLWVFQEVNSGPVVAMLCGRHSLDWNLVALTAAYIMCIPSLVMKSRMPISHINNACFMRDRHFHTKMELSTTLHRSRHLLCSDPLDKIYAMLAMPQFATMKPPWKADYSKSKLGLYCEVEKRYVLELKSLAILSCVQHTGGIDEAFPSWVPQWDQTCLCNTIGSRGDFEWNAGESSPGSASVDSNDRPLVAHALEVDHVVSEQNTEEPCWFDSGSLLQDHPMLDFWRSQTVQPTLYMTGESVVDVYSLLFTAGAHLIGGRKAVADITGFQAYFLAYIKHLSDLFKQSSKLRFDNVEGADRGVWDMYQRRARNASWHRSFFTTKKGYMGLGPNAIRPGDLVCVFFGAEVPHILRPKDGHYQLVGDAYVHGIMEGEAMAKLEARELQEKVFEIR